MSVWGTRLEVTGGVEAQLMEQLVDKTKEVLVDGKNGCLKAVRMRG